MALEFEQPETLQSSTRCAKAGTYHLVITDYVENPELKNRQIIEGGFEISCEIVCGTEQSEIGKTIKSLFSPPNERHKDGGKFALARMTKLYLAINRGKHEPGKKAVLSYETVVGRQFISKVVLREEKYADLDGDRTYHVDDIAAPDCPRSEEYLSAIPADLRIVADAGAGDGNVSLDDI